MAVVTLILVALTVLCSVAQAAETTFISAGSVWKYLDDGSDQGTGWQEVDFNDFGRLEGVAPLGYGTGSEATEVGFGDDPNNKYVTTYFRHRFTVTDASVYKDLTLRIRREDGAVVYLNGTEVFRTNMPHTGVIAYDTLAPAPGKHYVYYDWVIDPALLVEGINVVAVEVHQVSINSDDLLFDFLLVGSTGNFPVEIRKGPYLIYPGDNTEMMVLWQLNASASCDIEWGLNTTYSLGSMITNEYGFDHQHQYTISNLKPRMKYYYRVAVEESYYTGSFRAGPPPEARNVKFFAYGDSRSHPEIQDLVLAGMIATCTNDPKYQTFALHVGDYVGADTNIYWQAQHFNRSYVNILEAHANLPLNGCIGNHEDDGNVFKKYYPYPYVDNFYWSFDYGPAHVVVVAQGARAQADYSPGSAQLAWIESDLASSFKQWKFIILHAPGYSAGPHVNDTSVQMYIQPLCKTYGVDIVFAGDNHYYSRCEVDGVQHITTGGGGAPLYTPDMNAPYLVTAVQAHHFCKIDIQDTKLYFTAVDLDGAVIDLFTIIPGDLDGDGDVDLVDFSKFTNMWQVSGCEPSDWCGGADLTGITGATTSPGAVDLNDLAILADHWLEGVGP